MAHNENMIIMTLLFMYLVQKNYSAEIIYTFIVRFIVSSLFIENE